jgi:DNA-binding GntR family transcriptional regulator
MLPLLQRPRGARRNAPRAARVPGEEAIYARILAALFEHRLPPGTMLG